MRWLRFGRLLLLSVSFLSVISTLPSQAQDNPQKTFAESFGKAIAEKDVDGAAKLMDEASELKPEALAQFRIQLGSLMVREKREDEAAKQFNAALEATFAKLEDGSNPGLFASTAPVAIMMLRQSQPELADQWIDKGLSALESRLDSDKLSENHGFYAKIFRAKLNTPDEQTATLEKERLLSFVADCEKIFTAQSDPSPHARTMLDLWNDALTISAEENANLYLDKIQALAQSELKQSPSSAVLQSYTTAIANFVSRNARTDPDLASQKLDEATAFIEGIESDDTNVLRVRENFSKNIERLNKTIQSTRALMAMIGKPAPAIDPQEWLNGDPETLESLKGKVVLLDFWAVWCGPCIATFPHLKHLDAQYGPQGLTIIGVTRQYNFTWDEATSNASRSEQPISLEDEMTMLEKFIAKHQLTHRTMVTPKESKMQSEYQVSGIPHAVLLDKQGNIRLVKVGSGKKNAEEIEAMVQALIAE